MPQDDDDDNADKNKTATTATPAPTREKEFNDRSLSYLFIALSSLVNLISVANVENENHHYHNSNDNFAGNQNVGVAFGAVTFGLSVLILILDRTTSKIDYTSAAGGNVEGMTLVLFTLWWTVGVGFLTQVRGIAYMATNVYASAWITWALCIQTLNQWSASKDILTIAEITGITETLKSWYVLAFSSIVVTGSTLDFWFKATYRYTDDCIFGFCLATVSSVLAVGWILTHMNFISCCAERAWLVEVASAWVVIFLWIVNCAVLTRDGGIGSTITGTHYRSWKTTTEDSLDEFYPFEEAETLTNCSLVWTRVIGDDGGQQQQDSALVECPLDQEGVPGSNLYLASWLSLAASFHIALRWNAQRALELAQQTRRRVNPSHQQHQQTSSQKKTSQKPATPLSNNVQGDDDDDDDSEDFIDADATLPRIANVRRGVSSPISAPFHTRVPRLLAMKDENSSDKALADLLYPTKECDLTLGLTTDGAVAKYRSQQRLTHKKEQQDVKLKE
eukprot:scaffold961_cov136-Amphora_coffeaeformis.AAC.1